DQDAETFADMCLLGYCQGFRPQELDMSLWDIGLYFAAHVGVQHVGHGQGSWYATAYAREGGGGQSFDVSAIVQIDDPALTYFCDRELMAGQGSHDERLRREWEPDRQIPRAVEAINRITEGLAAEVQLHCCHSVYKRQSDVRGDYKPLLPRLGDLKVDRVNLEFAYTGTGEVSDLKELPDHLSVGMGVVDVRREAIPNTDDIATLAETAAATISPSCIALNPDCGFAPDAGEPPTIDEAYAKLTRLTEAARLLRERHAS
ncbi:MAG: hypothetical protein ABGZ35_30565, partial [Planctomycetaceae bacterium]